MKMLMLVEVILSKKSVNPETGKVVYQVYFNNPQSVKNEDGTFGVLPANGKVKCDQPLSRGWHLLVVKISSYEGQIFYTAIKEVKDPKVVQILNEEE